MTCDFQQCGILTSVDSDEPVQPLFKLRYSKCCLVSSLTFIDIHTLVNVYVTLSVFTRIAGTSYRGCGKVFSFLSV